VPTIARIIAFSPYEVNILIMKMRTNTTTLPVNTVLTNFPLQGLNLFKMFIQNVLKYTPNLQKRYYLVDK
jgi:hypothetical protein